MKLKFELKRLNKSKGKDFNVLCSLLQNSKGKPMKKDTLNKKLNGVGGEWTVKQIGIIAEYYELDICQVVKWIQED